MSLISANLSPGNTMSLRPDNQQTKKTARFWVASQKRVFCNADGGTKTAKIQLRACFYKFEFQGATHFSRSTQPGSELNRQ
jgi:hypothetical protein